MKKHHYYMYLATLCIIIFASCESLSIEVEPSAANKEELQSIEILGSVVVNIEGIITDVSEDGKTFLLDNGKWIITDRQTEIGIIGPNAPPKDEQYFEPTFRVGNSIAGFSQTPDGEILVAQAIYTNWNWEDPIK